MAISLDILNNPMMANALCEVLDDHIPSNLFVVRVEHIMDPVRFKRSLRFTYAKKNESLVARNAGKPFTEYQLEVGMPMWNTHINLEQIIAKFALVG